MMERNGEVYGLFVAKLRDSELFDSEEMLIPASVFDELEVFANADPSVFVPSLMITLTLGDLHFSWQDRF